MWGDSKHFHQSTKISILTKNSILALSGVHSEMHGDDMRDENQAISFIDVTYIDIPAAAYAITPLHSATRWSICGT